MLNMNKISRSEKLRVNNYKTKGLGINNPTQDFLILINNSPIITLIKTISH